MITAKQNCRYTNRTRFAARYTACACTLVLFALPLLTGCKLVEHPSIGGVGFGNAGESLVQNPLQIPDMNDEFVWNQVIDTLDNYFPINEEQRVIKSQQQWMEGHVLTLPQVSSGYLEPWLRDATPGYQRLQSTLQSTRRFADLRVIPNQSGYSVTVVVHKELEDVDRSQSAADGAASARHDGSVVRTQQNLLGPPITLGWIEQERDTELEQRILQEIRGRVTQVNAPRKRLFHH
jgi:hypothetical protein